MKNTSKNSCKKRKNHAIIFYAKKNEKDVFWDRPQYNDFLGDKQI
ncbi:hypothetical protein MgSA37_03436 [Mucilaginibacter gotjawali]|uniref:Uncharacterized protein n=2 Tax=Mucilaginibacter gotjawali TaxID=1550579 RepID=A0A110B3D1_9SPHI|nr:hypothetical protein [Mucilaginibacter gotjawali]BAU55255.1 hypothetical protein MgSA37_03436 [Mucilaginibacter gotjawali]